MAGFAVTRKAVLNAFRARWDTLNPAWDHASQTAYPPHTRELQADQWIRVKVTDQGGQNIAVGIQDEVTGLITVDCYNRVSISSMFGVDELADRAHDALRTIAGSADILDVDVIPQDLPVTPAGYEHKRLGMIFRYCLPEVA